MVAAGSSVVRSRVGIFIMIGGGNHSKISGGEIGNIIVSIVVVVVHVMVGLGKRCPGGVEEG